MLQVALYIVSGLTLYAGGHHLYLGGNRHSAHPHVQLGVLYLLLSGFALASAMTYQSPALDSLLPAAKVAVSLGLVLWCTLVWHVSLRAKFRPMLVLDVITAAWLVFLIQNIASHNSLIYADVTSVRQTQLSGETLNLVHAEVSLWWTAVEICMLVSLVYCAYAVYHLYRHKQKATALVMAAGLVWLALVSLFDHLVSVQLIHANYLTPFGFLGFLLTCSLYPVYQGWLAMRQARQPPVIHNLTFKPDYASFHSDVSQLRTPLEPLAETGEARKPAPSSASAFPVRADEDIEDVQAASESEVKPQNDTSAKPPEPSPMSPTEARIIGEVTDNLIDIAVYATMALNRFKRGEADPATLETLFKKVRSHAINTRRLASQLSRTAQPPQSGKPDDET